MSQTTDPTSDDAGPDPRGRGGFWSGEKLNSNRSIVEEFDPDSVDANAYNLRMGNCYFKTANDIETESKKTFLSPGESFVIPAGQFAFLLTKEVVDVPPYAMAFISMRTRIKFQGLINVSGFHVDPGYRGKLIYAVYNASPSPVHICEGDPIFKIWFADIDQRSGSRYLFKGQSKGDIDSDLVRGMSKEIFSLQSLAEQLRDLRSTIDHKLIEAKASVDQRLAEQKPVVDNLTFVWRAITLGVVAAIILAVLTLAWPTIQTLGAEIGRIVSGWFEQV